MPTYTTTARNGKTPGGLSIPQRQQQQQSTTVGSSIPVSAENASRKKSLLPQPRTVSRLPQKAQPQQFTGYTGYTQLPRPESQEQPTPPSNISPELPRPASRPEPENAVKEAPPLTTTTTALPSRPKTERVVTRARSKSQLPKPGNQEQPTQKSNASPEPPRPVSRPEPENVEAPPPTVTTLPSRPKTERVVTRSRSKSPIKPTPPQKDDSKPTATTAAAPVPAAAAATAATKKTSMPPPSSRPARSASLRQPSAPKLVSSTEGKGHARHRSQVLSTPRTIGNAPVLSAPPARQQPERPSTAKQARPQFNTYQQHYSPKKEKEPPRTLPATERKTAKSIETDTAVSALQTELLQLCLLHSSSLQQDKEWKSAAQRQLQHKYYSVAARYRTLADEERCIQQQLNLKALHDWSVDSAGLAEHDDGSDTEFQAQIQSFSQITQDVADVTAEGGGRYTSVVRVFEGWLDRVEHIQAARNGSSAAADSDEDYITTLGRVWREEVDDLTFKSELCLRRLTTKMTIFAINEHEFHKTHSASALVQIARAHRDVLTLMVEELRGMRAVEVEVVNREKAWLGRAADQVVVDDRSNVKSNSRRGVWRS